MTNKISLLIEVLLDKNAREDERDDAAMDLGNYNDDQALNALIKVATDPLEDNDTLSNSCGESIAAIFIKRGQYDRKIVDHLSPSAKNGALAMIQSQRPEWMLYLHDIL